MTPLLTKLLAGQLVPVDAAVSSNMMDNQFDTDDKPMYLIYQSYVQLVRDITTYLVMSEPIMNKSCLQTNITQPIVCIFEWLWGCSMKKYGKENSTKLITDETLIQNYLI